MSLKQTIITVIVAVLTSVVTVYVVTPEQQQSINKSSDQESVFDRVMRTGQLRCGYQYQEPTLLKDKDGQLYGSFYDVMEELGETIGVEIVWSEEVGWGEIGTAVESDRIDAMCASVFSNGQRGRVMSFSKPVYYMSIDPYIHIDNNDIQSFDDINSPEVTISIVDNGLPDLIARKTFPKAKTKSLPQLATNVDLLMDVVYKKADVTFGVSSIAMGFIRENPGTIKKVPSDAPLRVAENTIAVKQGADDFLSLLNAGITEMIDNGVVDQILQKYDTDYPGVFLRVAKPYQE